MAEGSRGDVRNFEAELHALIKPYMDEVRGLYPPKPMDGVHGHFLKLLENVAVYRSNAERASSLRNLLRDVEHSETNPSEAVREMYQGMEPEKHQQLVGLMQTELARLDGLAKDEEDQRLAEVEAREKRQLEALEVGGDLQDEPTWDKRHPSITLLGEKRFYNLRGVTRGARVRIPDVEGEWVASGWTQGAMGVFVTFTPPETFERTEILRERYFSTDDRDEKLAIMAEFKEIEEGDDYQQEVVEISGLDDLEIVGG